MRINAKTPKFKEFNTSNLKNIIKYSELLSDVYSNTILHTIDDLKNAKCSKFYLDENLLGESLVIGFFDEVLSSGMVTVKLDYAPKYPIYMSNTYIEFVCKVESLPLLVERDLVKTVYNLIEAGDVMTVDHILGNNSLAYTTPTMEVKTISISNGEVVEETNTIIPDVLEFNEERNFLFFKKKVTSTFNTPVNGMRDSVIFLGDYLLLDALTEVLYDQTVGSRFLYTSIKYNIRNSLKELLDCDTSVKVLGKL